MKKKKFGNPQRFRVCYGKNTDTNVFDTGKLLFDHGLDKGVNLSRQSNSKQVLANIKRGNIKMDTYRSLQSKFADSGIPTWTELIVGLPGETYDSFVAGIEEVLNSELKSLYLYWLEAFPNTDMGDPDYQAKFGIKLRTSDIKPIHCATISNDKVMENVPIVVETASMPHDQWRRTWKLAWLLMAVHSLGASSFVLHFLRRQFDIPYTDFVQFLVDEAGDILPNSLVSEELNYYNTRLDDIYDGAGWGVEYEKYGDLYWFTEDCSFLRFSADKDRFFQELEELLGIFLDKKGITIDPEILSEIIRYQWLRMPSAVPPPIQQWQFRYNIPEFMNQVVTDNPVDGGAAARSRAPNVYQLNIPAITQQGIRYEDIVASVDVVLSKPGYGIIAECAANDTALLYTSRGAFAEYHVLVDAMPKLVRCAYIEHDQLFAGAWSSTLQKLLDQPTAAPPRTDGAAVVARRLASYL